ncbi:MAG: hypothetical protein MHMPM18_004436 [Marteilia pararefringens]
MFATCVLEESKEGLESSTPGNLISGLKNILRLERQGGHEFGANAAEYEQLEFRAKMLIISTIKTYLLKREFELSENSSFCTQQRVDNDQDIPIIADSDHLCDDDQFKHLNFQMNSKEFDVELIKRLKAEIVTQFISK